MRWNAARTFINCKPKSRNGNTPLICVSSSLRPLFPSMHADAGNWETWKCFKKSESHFPYVPTGRQQQGCSSLTLFEKQFSCASERGAYCHIHLTVHLDSPWISSSESYQGLQTIARGAVSPSLKTVFMCKWERCQLSNSPYCAFRFTVHLVS